MHWSLRRRIEQCVIRNPGDWAADDLFDALGAIDGASDARFGLFLEGLASSGVVPYEPAQRRVAATANRVVTMRDGGMVSDAEQEPAPFQGAR